MHALLSRRERYLLGKFRMGYTAWARPGKYTAFLVPGKHIVNGKQERVRTSLLWHLVRLGYLNETQDRSPIYNVPGDIRWQSKTNTAE